MSRKVKERSLDYKWVQSLDESEFERLKEIMKDTPDFCEARRRGKMYIFLTVLASSMITCFRMGKFLSFLGMIVGVVDAIDSHQYIDISEEVFEFIGEYVVLKWELSMFSDFKEEFSSVSKSERECVKEFEDDILNSLKNNNFIDESTSKISKSDIVRLYRALQKRDRIAKRKLKTK